MNLLISYTYTPDLSRTIFVERAEHVTRVTLTVPLTQLSPRARSALLGVTHVGYQYQARTLALAFDPPSLDVGCVPELFVPNRLTQLAMEWPDPVDTEVNVARATQDVETLLVRAEAATPAILAAVGAARERAEAAKREQVEADIVSYLAAPLDVWLEEGDNKWRVDNYRPRLNLPRPLSELIALDPRLAVRADEAKAEAERRNVARAAEAELRESRRTSWIEIHAPEFVPRWSEGLLPEKELLARVRDVVFAGLADWPRYVRIVDSDLWHDEHCMQAVPIYSTEDADELTADEYTALDTFRVQAPPGATVEAREHVGYCAGCNGDKRNDHDVVRRSVRVTVDWHGTSVSREYGLAPR
jgi:hypothetical protein